MSHKVIENSTEVYRGQHESCEIVQNTMKRKNRTHTNITNTLQTTATVGPVHPTSYSFGAMFPWSLLMLVLGY